MSATVVEMARRIDGFASEMREKGVHVGINGECVCGVPWPCDGSSKLASDRVDLEPDFEELTPEQEAGFVTYRHSRKRVSAAPQLVPERQPPPQAPGGARWCFDHERWECKKSRSKGRGTCHGSAIRGTDACKMHAGVSPAVARERGQAMITAWNAIGATPNIDYRMAVLGVLQMTYLRLGAYSELLRRQVSVEGDAIPAEPFDPDDGSPKTSGLIGYRYGAAGKDGRIYAQSEEIRALVALESAERDRVVKYAKTAHDMGISERLTSLAERWGDVVANRITALLSDLNLTPEQMAIVPKLVELHLGSIDTAAIEGPVKDNGASRRGVRDGGGPSR